MAVWSLAVVLLLAAGRPPLQAQDQTPPGASYRIDTFAGSRDVRDNGPATAARLNRPRGVAVDGAGNLYIADRYNHRIRKVDSTGVITTIAGTGEFGAGGDGGPATQAQLAFPTNVAVDGAGNLYIADASNHRIRRVDPSGSITTIAGTGERGFAGDGGPATQAQLAFPTDVAVDGAGNLYIADAGNHRIRRVDPSGSITTIAGTGERGFAGDGGPATQARLYDPSGVAVDRAGNLYIADSGNHRIRRVSQSGTITTIAGTGERGFGGDGGPAVEAQLYYPRGVAVGQMGDLYIADISNHRIRRVGRSGTITTFAGTRARGFSGDGGPATQARLYHPSGVAVGQLGDLYIADISNHRIRKVDSTGVITTIAGTGEFGDGGPATQALLYYPVGVAVGQFGDDVYIADTSNHRIRRVDPSGTITTFAGTGERGCCLDGAPPTQALLYHPDGVAVDVGGTGDVYIADTFNHRIRRVEGSRGLPLATITTFAGTGEFGDGGDGGPATQARLYYPGGVAVAVEPGNLYIADIRNHRIRKVDSLGVITTIAGTGESGFGGDGGPATQAQLRYPRGVALYWELYGRWAGREGERNLYIADSGNHRIRRVDPSGTITTFAGTGESGFGGDGGPAVEAQLNNPAGVAVDRAGYVYIADSGNHRIRRVDLSGTITTLAGTGASGFSGDGGPAVEAQLYDPSGVAVDGAGNIYIADTGNHLVRKLTPGGGSTPPNPTGPAVTLPGKPPAPTVSAATPNSLTVEWMEPENTGPAITDYDVQYREGGSGGFTDAQHEGTALTATLTGLSPDTVYEVQVRARNATGTGAWSESGEGRTSPQQTIDTIAGTGEEDFSGDGGPAVQAYLNSPNDVAVDSAGNLYIADSGNSRIRKVDSSGVISTIAGTGEPGFGGDGGPAVLAQLKYPTGVVTDDTGNLYIAGYNNQRIRKVDSSGIITTVAGSERGGFSGDGGPATAARLDYPKGVATDGAGNLYIADSYRVRKVDPSGIITTIAGTGEFGFGGDGGLATEARLSATDVATDGIGNLYIADSSNNRIRMVDPSGIITTVAGQLNYPSGVVTDDTGNLFIGDQQNNRIRMVDSAGTITTIAGSGEWGFGGDGGPAAAAGLAHPRGVALDGSGNLYIADRDNHRIRVVKTNPLQTGDQIYYFPHLAVGASWQTTITYINYSPEEVSCQTEFLSDQGTPLMVSFADKGTVPSRTDVLLPGGSVHQETNVELNAPFAPGWARATCSGPVKASLLFRLHNSEGVPIAEGGVNAAAVPATRFVTFAEQGEGKQGTGVAYANPSATEAVVTFTARDADGQMLASVDKNLSPNGHAAQNMAPLFALSSFTGSLEVTSTAPIVSLSINAEAAPVFSSLPPGELDAAAQGSTTYYFPHLAVGQKWQTTITYINYSSQEVRCTTEFLSDQGTPLMVSFADKGTVPSRTDVLLPGGSVHQETNVELNAPFAPGWARATCSGPVKASLLFRLHNSEGVPIAEGGVNAAAVPATRFVTFAEQGEGKQGTGVAYANPSATEAIVTFTAKDALGQTLASVDKTLLSNEHAAQNMAPLFALSSFTGSLEVTSTVPIVSLSINAEAAPVFSSLPPGELDASAQ